MAELADARDLKSREIYFSYRFDPGFRHHHIAEWSSLVARRAHNPKVMRFKSHLRNQRKEAVHLDCFFLSLREVAGDLSLVTFEVMSSRSQGDPRANNLRASKNLLNDGFCVAKHHKARSRQSRRLAKAIGDDYATGAVGHEVKVLSFSDKRIAPAYATTRIFNSRF